MTTSRVLRDMLDFFHFITVAKIRGIPLCCTYDNTQGQSSESYTVPSNPKKKMEFRVCSNSLINPFSYLFTNM